MLGYQQSKLRYSNETQVLDVAQRFHDENVNVSLIVVGAVYYVLPGLRSFIVINFQISSPGNSKETGDWNRKIIYLPYPNTHFVGPSTLNSGRTQPAWLLRSKRLLAQR